MSETILVVDDELAMRLGLKEVLGRAGYAVETANDGAEAIERLDRGGLDVVITDLRMPNKDGLEVLRHAQSRHPDVLVFLMSAHGDIPTAIQAIKDGAQDFIQKPFKIDDVRARIRAGLDARGERKRPKGDQAFGEVDPAIWNDFPELVGRSPALASVLHTLRRVATSPLPVLVLGETGTGKELVAKAIHRLSKRTGALVATTGQLSPSLVESELFGHTKGSFTGAVDDKTGYFEAASKGTLFLDEVGDLPYEVQVKLLRVVQEKEVVRVGEALPRKIDARLVAATHKDLVAEVAAKRFREDLLYRLNVITLVLPPLRERGDDVLLLGERFLAECAQEAGRELVFGDSAKEVLMGHRWKGNVRELLQACRGLALLADGEEVTADEVRDQLA
ncbi:MAG: sigma-54-dependent Fis family transcriptional regulator [Planctomycetes bacterium]|nr:sigma-54-dependent Fis family transcriptional regulator [Planctomycetota bacterium]